MNASRAFGSAWRRLALAVLMAGPVACGPIDDVGGGGGLGNGPVCYQDSDCVPDGCCGEGTGAVHVSQAPSCAGVTCTGSCPESEVRCGCGLPVCRDNQCTVALTTGSGC